jgi:hypothetical protein
MGDPEERPGDGVAPGQRAHGEADMPGIDAILGSARPRSRSASRSPGARSTTPCRVLTPSSSWRGPRVHRAHDVDDFAFEVTGDRT